MVLLPAVESLLDRNRSDFCCGDKRHVPAPADGPPAFWVVTQASGTRSRLHFVGGSPWAPTASSNHALSRLAEAGSAPAYITREFSKLAAGHGESRSGRGHRRSQQCPTALSGAGQSLAPPGLRPALKSFVAEDHAAVAQG